jgi:hypothetical protein
MKHIAPLLLFIVCIVANSAPAQTLFSLDFGDEDYVDYVVSMAETKAGNYLALVRRVNPFYTYTTLLEIDQQGNVVAEKDFESDLGLQLNDLFYTDSVIYLVGTRVGADTSFLTTFLLNQSLETVKTAKYPMGDFRESATYMVAFDTCFVLSGSFINFSPFSFKGFIAKIDFEGNFIKVNPNIGNAEIGPAALHPTGERIHVLSFSRKVYETDEALNLVGSEPSPFDMYREGELVYMPDTSILIVGRMSDSDGYDITVGFLGTDWQEENLIRIGRPKDTLDTPTANHAISHISPSEVLIGGTSNFLPGEWLYTDAYSWFCLSSVDIVQRKLNWTRYYGGDAYYVMFGKLITSDGHVIMYGSKHADFSINDANGYLLKVKVEPTSLTNESPKIPYSTCQAYPNPGSGLFSFDKNNADPAALSVYDAQGKMVRQMRFNGQKTTVDLSAQPPGLYHYEIISEKRQWCSGTVEKQ